MIHCDFCYSGNSGSLASAPDAGDAIELDLEDVPQTAEEKVLLSRV